MEQQEAPFFSAPHDRSFFQMINFYIAIGVVIFGLWTGEIFLATLGFVVGAVYWFTTPRYYHILADRLVVMYGQPRILVIPFDAIFDVNIVRVPLTSGIFVRRVSKAGVIIRPRDMEGFVGQLWMALNAAGAPPRRTCWRSSPRRSTCPKQPTTIPRTGRALRPRTTFAPSTVRTNRTALPQAADAAGPGRHGGRHPWQTPSTSGSVFRPFTPATPMPCAALCWRLRRSATTRSGWATTSSTASTSSIR